MAPSSTNRRREKTIRNAVVAVYQGMSFRKAADSYGLPKATVHDALYAPTKPRVPAHHRQALTPGEEDHIISLLCRYADKGVPLTRQHVEAAVEIIVEGMTVSRRICLPFANGRPGKNFFKGFMKRHSDALRFLRPLKQEHEILKAVNGNTLCQDFATLERIVSEHNLDASRIWNLDECGITPGRDANGRCQKKRLLRKDGSQDVRVMSCAYDKRITLMPVISASGETGPCLFVFKGKTIPYRRVLVDGKGKVDTIANHLPRRAVVAMREEGGGVDKNNFLEWAYHFVVTVRDLTSEGNKVLLVYDWYRSHMSPPVLRLFAKAGVIVYALPSHTSGKTQPLDAVAFSSFKRKFNQLMFDSTARFTESSCTLYDMCDLMSTAYNETFTPTIIQASFRRSGIWPVDATKLLKVPRPKDSTLSAVLSVDQLEALMEKKREEANRDVFGKEVTVLESGFVDTTCGAVLTTDAAIKAVEKRAAEVKRTKAAKDLEQKERALRAATREKKARMEVQRMQAAVTARRARMAGMEVGIFKARQRTLKERRALARLRAAHKHAFFAASM